MRNRKQVVVEIRALLERYVQNDEKKCRYLRELDTIYPPPVRGIFSEMKQDGIEISDGDADLVHDAFFYFG